MNPMILGIAVVAAAVTLIAMSKKDPGDVMINGPQRFFVGPSAGFYGGSGGRLEEKPLLPY